MNILRKVVGVLAFSCLTFTAAFSDADEMLIPGNARVEEDLTVEGNTALEGALEVDGATTLSAGLTVFGMSSINGQTLLRETLDVTGDLAINTDKFTVAADSGNTHVDGTLDVEGETTLRDNVAMLADLTVSGSPRIHGQTLMKDDVTVEANTDLQGTLDVAGDVTVNTDKFTVAADSGNTVVAGTLDVEGETTLRDNVAMLADLTVSGSPRIHGQTLMKDDVTVEANTDLQGTLDVAGDVTVNTDKFTVAAASGDTVVAGTLEVEGAATLNGSLDVTGAVTLDDTLDVDGATLLHDALDVEGLMHAHSHLTVTGSTSLFGNIKIGDDVLTIAVASGNIHTDGTLDVDGPTVFNDTLDVVGNTHLHGDVTVTGTTSFNDNFIVRKSNGDASITLDANKGDVTIARGLDVGGVIDAGGAISTEGAFTAGGAISAQGNITGAQSLTVSQNITCGQTCNIGGDCNIAGDCDIEGTLSVTGGSGAIQALALNDALRSKCRSGINAAHLMAKQLVTSNVFLNDNCVMGSLDVDNDASCSLSINYDQGSYDFFKSFPSGAVKMFIVNLDGQEQTSSCEALLGFSAGAQSVQVVKQSGELLESPSLQRDDVNSKVILSVPFKKQGSYLVVYELVSKGLVDVASGEQDVEEAEQA